MIERKTWPPGRGEFERVMASAADGGEAARYFGVSEAQIDHLLLWYERHGRIVPGWQNINPFLLNDDEVEILARGGELPEDEPDEDDLPSQRDYARDAARRNYDPNSGLTKLEYALAKLGSRVKQQRDYYTLDGRPTNVWAILAAAGVGRD